MASGEKGEHKTIIKIEPEYFRPAEVDSLMGDANKANKELGWQSKISLDELAEDMVLKDLKLAENEKFLLNKGR